MSTSFRTVTPMIPAGANLDAGIDLYVRHLGFSLLWRHGDMAGIRRGDVAFNLVRNSNRVWAENASFSVGVSGLDALYGELRGAPLTLGPLEPKPWGRRELHVIVPPGVCLQFFEAEAEPARE